MQIKITSHKHTVPRQQRKSEGKYPTAQNAHTHTGEKSYHLQFRYLMHRVSTAVAENSWRWPFTASGENSRWAQPVCVPCGFHLADGNDETSSAHVPTVTFPTCGQCVRVCVCMSLPPLTLCQAHMPHT